MAAIFAGALAVVAVAWIGATAATQVIDMAVQLVVDYPDQLATYARERHRASGSVDRGW